LIGNVVQSFPNLIQKVLGSILLWLVLLLISR
jgi:hypothetical protein